MYLKFKVILTHIFLIVIHPLLLISNFFFSPILFILILIYMHIRARTLIHTPITSHSSTITLINPITTLFTIILQTHLTLQETQNKTMVPLIPSMRVDLNGTPYIKPNVLHDQAERFIGSYMCEQLMLEMPHKALNIYHDKVKHLVESDTLPWL